MHVPCVQEAPPTAAPRPRARGRCRFGLQLVTKLATDQMRTMPPLFPSFFSYLSSSFSQLSLSLLLYRSSLMPPRKPTSRGFPRRHRTSTTSPERRPAPAAGAPSARLVGSASPCRSPATSPEATCHARAPGCRPRDSLSDPTTVGTPDVVAMASDPRYRSPPHDGSGRNGPPRPHHARTRPGPLACSWPPASAHLAKVQFSRPDPCTHEEEGMSLA